MRAKRVKEIRKFVKAFSKSENNANMTKTKSGSWIRRLETDSVKLFTKKIKKFITNTSRGLRSAVVPALMFDILMKQNQPQGTDGDDLAGLKLLKNVTSTSGLH